MQAWWRRVCSTQRCSSGETRCCCGEDPVVREQEVREAADCDGEGVCEQDGQVGGVNEEVHERDVAAERDDAVREMEAEKAFECVGATGGLGPGVVLMPGEVVQDGELHRNG